MTPPKRPPADMPATAMVFAAGLGTRMRPLTETVPKPLIRVAGRALMDHSLDRLATAGVGTAVVNVHYLAGMIEAHLETRERPKIIVSDERARLLDQGGGIRKMLPVLGPAPFFIVNTDALWIEGPRDTLHRLAEAWDASRMDILLLVAATAESIGVDWPGDFTMDADGCLTRRAERTVAPFVYAGIGIVRPELFGNRPDDVFRLAPFFFAAAEAGRLFGVRLEGLWLHVGTPEAVQEAEAALSGSTR